MDADSRRQAAELRCMSSAEAADWLISRYPRESEGWGKAVVLLDHVSLAKADNLRLARHYLTGLPFASGRCYEVFARRLGISDLVQVIGANLPVDASKLDLLLYYLDPILRHATRSQKADEALRSFEALVAARRKEAAPLQQ